MAREARSRCLRNRKPHPCGFFTDVKRECRCSQRQIQTYRNKISGPLLDRIDIHIEVPAVAYDDLSSMTLGESSTAMRDRVMSARGVQGDRFRQVKKVHSNSDMQARHLQTHCAMGEEARAVLKSAISDLNFSARAYDRILKVSRTIADLEAADTIQVHHIHEAIQYRTLDRQLWV